MTAPRYARLIAEVWKRAERRAIQVPAAANRDEEIALIEQAIDRKRRNARRFRQAAYASVAATMLLAATSVWRAQREHVAAAPAAAHAVEARHLAGGAPIAIAIASGSGSIVAAPGSATPAVAGRALRAGSRLIVDPSAGATLSLSTGTRLEVEHNSQLTVIEDGRTQVFALNAGSLHADVAKLGQSERFIVRTRDAEVEVRGTSFFVSVVAADPECGGGTTTRVSVYEGVVAVRSEEREESLRAGEQWPRGCRKGPAQAPAAHESARRAIKVEAPAARAVSGSSSETSTAPTPLPPPPTSPSGPSSTLAEENNLFAEGMMARRSGKLTLALDKMDRLLERYPTSHLAENAAAERMRLLRAVDPTKAKAAARLYLQRYPAGFARTDAEAILAGTR